MNPAKDDFVFMQIDTDYYTAVPPANIKNSQPGVETCIIRMFGITAGQNSVAIHVHNFTPYFYVKVNTAAMPKPLGPDDLQAIKD